MRIFLIGDYRTGTGPANVTKEYLVRLPENTLCQKAVSKAARVPELIVKILCADVILCSGYSAQNVLAMKLAHRFNKKAAYLMHGAVEHENGINSVPDERMTSVERQTLELADVIFAVSEGFEGWLINNYPEYKSKISHVTNGVEYKEVPLSDKRDTNMIFSVGGGMPRKQIKYIAEAIDLLNERREAKGLSPLMLTVTGDIGRDSNELNAHKCVNNLGLVNRDKVASIYSSCSLFIQNSCFETFGLAPMEALTYGASILLSKEIGAIEILRGMESTDIINDGRDVTEIADKIEYLLDNPNRDRIYMGIDKELTSWEARTGELIEKLTKLI